MKERYQPILLNSNTRSINRLRIASIAAAFVAILAFAGILKYNHEVKTIESASKFNVIQNKHVRTDMDNLKRTPVVLASALKDKKIAEKTSEMYNSFKEFAKPALTKKLAK